MKAMNIDLQEWQVRFVLEALRVLEKHWGDTAATCNDEDGAADIGNDLIRLTAAHDYLERQAVKAFGSGITKFSGEPFAPATIANGETAATALKK
jgi:hypothetical protein